MGQPTSLFPGSTYRYKKLFICFYSCRRFRFPHISRFTSSFIFNLTLLLFLIFYFSLSFFLYHIFSMYPSITYSLSLSLSLSYSLSLSLALSLSLSLSRSLSLSISLVLSVTVSSSLPLSLSFVPPFYFSYSSIFLSIISLPCLNSPLSLSSYPSS